MRKMVSVLSVLTAVAVGVGLAYATGGPLLERLAGDAETESDSSAEDAPVVDTAQASEEDISDLFPAVGNTRAVRSVELVPRSAGVVTALDIPNGERVEEGYGLVQLDDRAERALLRQAQARLGDARAAVDRARQLAQRDVAADVALETAEATLDLVEAEVEEAMVAVEDRRIVTPFAGTLGITDVELGQRLEPTDIVVTLDDVSQVEIAFTLPETLFGRIVPGQAVAATGAGEGLRVEGEVEVVGTRIDPAGRFFEVRARFDNADGALATGMFMNVELTLETRRSVTVPEIAIVNVGEEAFVFVPSEGRARERAVRVGLYRDGAVEILEGLDDGELVIVSGLQSIADGDAVSVADEGADGSAEVAAESVR